MHRGNKASKMVQEMGKHIRKKSKDNDPCEFL